MESTITIQNYSLLKKEIAKNRKDINHRLDILRMLEEAISGYENMVDLPYFDIFGKPGEKEQRLKEAEDLILNISNLLNELS